MNGRQVWVITNQGHVNGDRGHVILSSGIL